MYYMYVCTICMYVLYVCTMYNNKWGEEVKIVNIATSTGGLENNH